MVSISMFTYRANKCEWLYLAMFLVLAQNFHFGAIVKPWDGVLLVKILNSQ